MTKTKHLENSQKCCLKFVKIEDSKTSVPYYVEKKSNANKKLWKIQRKKTKIISPNYFQFNKGSANKTIGLKNLLERNILERGQNMHCKKDLKN